MLDHPYAPRHPPSAPSTGERQGDNAAKFMRQIFEAFMPEDVINFHDFSVLEREKKYGRIKNFGDGIRGRGDYTHLLRGN